MRNAEILGGSNDGTIVRVTGQVYVEAIPPPVYWTLEEPVPAMTTIRTRMYDLRMDYDGQYKYVLREER